MCYFSSNHPIGSQSFHHWLVIGAWKRGLNAIDSLPHLVGGRMQCGVDTNTFRKVTEILLAGHTHTEYQQVEPIVWNKIGNSLVQLFWLENEGLVEVSPSVLTSSIQSIEFSQLLTQTCKHTIRGNPKSRKNRKLLLIFFCKWESSKYLSS